MKNVLVIAVTPSENSRRRVAEDAFVKDLGEHGVRAVSSYSLVPDASKMNQGRWKQVVLDHHFDTVVVSRLVDIKNVEREVPPTAVMQSGAPISSGYYNSASGFGPGWYGYYANSYQIVTQPGYTIKDRVAVIETKVYDVPTEKMAWSGNTQTTLGSDSKTDDLIHQFAGVVIDSIFGGK